MILKLLGDGVFEAQLSECNMKFALIALGSYIPYLR